MPRERVVYVRVDDELYERLVAEAASDDRSLSSLVRHLLRSGLRARR